MKEWMGDERPHTLYQSKNERFKPYFQFCEQHIRPGKQKGVPLLFPNLKIVRIVSGECTWRLPRLQYALTGGDYIIFNNLEPRALTEVTGDEVLVLEQAIVQPMSFPPELFSADAFYLCREELALHSPVIHPTMAHYAMLDESYRALSAEIRAENRTEPMVYARYLTVAAAVARCFGADTQKKSMGTLRISEITQYIHLCIAEPELSSASIAHHFGMSQARLLSTFSECTGMSISKYIRQMRVQNVILLLRQKRINVFEAALESGFHTSSGFYKAFREVTGMTPQEAIRDTISIV